jgi:hypothetical protein
VNRFRTLMAALAIAALVLTGCSSATTACEPKGTSVNICVNGHPIDFSQEPFQPHVHEPGNIYAPVLPVAEALGLIVEVNVEALTVSIGDIPFAVPAATDSFMGIHVHEGNVFVPLKEFATAIGAKMAMDADNGTAGFNR